MAKTKRYFNSNDDFDVPSPRQRNKGRGNGRGAPRGAGRGGSVNALLSGLDQSEAGSSVGRGSPRGATPKRPGYHLMQDVEFEVQQWPSGSGYNTPRGRGSFSGRGSPSRRGSFDSSPRGNFRGRGNGRGGSGKGAKSKLPGGAPLSKLLHETRPLLRPIKFVRSQFTATLFEEADDIFEPVAESSTSKAESHAPTANAVARVFSGGAALENYDDIEEVDFADMGRIREEVEKLANEQPPQESKAVEVRENFTGFYIDTRPSQIEDSNSGGPDQDEPVLPAGELPTPETELSTEGPEFQNNPISIEHNVVEQIAIDVELPPAQSRAIDNVADGQTEVTDQPNLLNEAQQVSEEAIVSMEAGEGRGTFYVDTQPSLQDTSQHVSFDPTDQSAPLGAPQNDDDDIIVYEAPNPRSGRATTGSQQVTLPKPPPTTIADISFADSPKTQYSRQINPLHRGTLFERASRKGKGKAARRKLSAHPKFGSFGAMMAESALHQEEEHDPRKDQRRKGDSDLDWGDESESDADGNNAPVAEGMDLDPDLVGEGVTIDAMRSFVDGISGKGSQFVTMDDLEDVERKKAEMENSSDEGEGEGEEAISDEEAMLVADFEDDDSDHEDDEDSSETDGSPRSGFQARLERLRERQGKQLDVLEGEDEDDKDEDEDDEDEDIVPDFNWTRESPQEYVDEVEEFIDTNNLRIHARNRIVQNQVLQAIQVGYFDDPVASSSKAKNVPPELREQWEKDRAKKAENKQKRQLQRLIAAVDPLAVHKGGKKSHKAILAAARLDPAIEIPHRIVNMGSVEEQIRRFLTEPTKNTMALPPADKETRKKIHLLAKAFNLKTQSKGKGNERYVMLFRTKHTEWGFSEEKIAKMLRKFGARSSYDGPDSNGKGKGKGRQSLGLKTVEGQVVGHTAPKIDNSNIGFRMLASMGWADGDTIGLSGGLEAPITAVIKKTKLGLGAQR